MKTVFPGSAHVNTLGMSRASDIEIWNVAKQRALAVVTIDVDFVELSLIKGFPPKIVWLRRGNSTTKEIEKLLKIIKDVIFDFLKNTSNCCLQLK